jgi:hypothetical protein
VSVRVAGIVVFALGLTALLGYLQVAAKGPFANAESRHLRAMKERVVPPDTLAPVTHADFAAMPAGLPLERYAPMERHGVTIEGYVQKMFYSPDGDLHLEITPGERRPGSRDTVYVTAEITLPMRHRHEGWTYATLYAAFRPDLGVGPRPHAAPRRVRLGGWLTYDFQYDGLRRPADPARMLWNRFGLSRPYRPHGAISIWPRLSGWEVHPVTRIEVWDDARGGFGEVRP